ncbi:MAG: hypothetical protein UY39_C0009G0009 [Candidatus Kaiserbacteria bacterium GW2011_GWC2_49_12]|uniref:DUF4015 domain-containing protein n=4 Tax=Candidatus Kaiseribacteriota TaxID=1752734 RepID=A0A0G1WG99_9BACT|nr:MAG: hypothetical protein UY39_C0009G0009 [Candidatus Kaiserbacteria bacterium GW2011_GWC2_49_12]KKW17786.1 MAG: hypothetical protein UY57_C0010G0016 [Candidatus Kaiserbacteria bacterium GW2011_GWB1_50_17]KKW18360.1 MAG: hypothetical protein UY59_C0008G0016 [Candidatus Kaiserbacteria bacterium GW2011_GWA1_50_28]OGG87980.1 MAG: hypothetical protein A3H15_00710 [Candidatus Kaiserbacteria bacterium RIFCSPLOWO2_12_FULL_50_28]HCM43849.1 hypothetical protein [Candidatus Kaiserbacteria bacterium]
MTRYSAGLLASTAFIALGTAGVFAYSSGSPQLSFVRISGVYETSTSTQPTVPAVKHIPTPVPVKAIYMTQCAAGTPSFRDDLTKLIYETELNAIVIDIKDYSGGIAFPSDDPMLAPYVSDKCGANDMKEFVKELHDNGVYVIGRITVFQDPLYTKAHPELAVKKASATSTPWKDHKGLSFIDVGARPFWEYIATLAKESYAMGFDELNFDYIRFPSDGDMKDIYFPWSIGKGKQVALEEFYRFLQAELKLTGAVLSADLFGMTATNEDDLNIGQVLERTLPYFDYVAPMVYPSHYPKGFHGYTDVNANAYNIVHFSMSEAVRRTLATTTATQSFTHTRIGTSTPAIYEKPSYAMSVMRPWLQSFDYPVAYTPAMVEAQIKAVNDAGLYGYMFWDPANKYRSLRQVLQQE